MLISKPRPREGICFAWKPKHTPCGKVWLEFVHYRHVDAEFGSVEYARMLPAELHDVMRHSYTFSIHAMYLHRHSEPGESGWSSEIHRQTQARR